MDNIKCFVWIEKMIKIHCFLVHYQKLLNKYVFKNLDKSYKMDFVIQKLLWNDS